MGKCEITYVSAMKSEETNRFPCLVRTSSMSHVTIASLQDLGSNVDGCRARVLCKYDAVRGDEVPVRSGEHVRLCLCGKCHGCRIRRGYR